MRMVLSRRNSRSGVGAGNSRGADCRTREVTLVGAAIADEDESEQRFTYTSMGRDEKRGRKLALVGCDVGEAFYVGKSSGVNMSLWSTSAAGACELAWASSKQTLPPRNHVR